MKLKLRKLMGESDYEKIKAFLRDVLVANDFQEKSWLPARLDYWRWHVIKNGGAYPGIKDVTFLWETETGEIGSVLNPEGQKEVFLQIHPDYLSETLLSDMISIAEKELSGEGKNGKNVLVVWANRSNQLQRNYLAKRGYALIQDPEAIESLRRVDLTREIAQLAFADGYLVRQLSGIDEVPARCWASWRAFHPDDPPDEYDGFSWYFNVQNAPLYKQSLDIVAKAPDGSVAAFVTGWYDEKIQCGYLEPVGTAPEHQRKGLGTAVILECLRRLKALGGRYAFVGGYSNAANALYQKISGDPYDYCEPWIHRGLE